MAYFDYAAALGDNGVVNYRDHTGNRGAFSSRFEDPSVTNEQYYIGEALRGNVGGKAVNRFMTGFTDDPTSFTRTYHFSDGFEFSMNWDVAKWSAQGMKVMKPAKKSKLESETNSRLQEQMQTVASMYDQWAYFRPRPELYWDGQASVQAPVKEKSTLSDMDWLKKRVQDVCDLFPLKREEEPKPSIWRDGRTAYDRQGFITSGDLYTVTPMTWASSTTGTGVTYSYIQTLS